MHSTERPARKRVIVVLALLSLTLLGQWCTVFGECREHNPGEHCCLLCHIGPQATLDAVAPAAAAPALSAVFLLQPAETTIPREAPVSVRSSRAPPSDSLS